MFIGQTRFSLFLPGSSAWKATSKDNHRDLNSYREYLYSDDRMQLRSRIFFDHSIPLLARASKNHRIRHIVSYSKSLPYVYRSQLENAAKEFGFLVLDERPDGVGPSDWRELLDFEVGLEDLVGVYRLDDDDLLSDDYFDRARKYLNQPFVGMRLSFGRVAQVLYSEGKFSLPRDSRHPMNAIGLMDIGQKISTFEYELPKVASHNRSDTVGPVILESSSISSLWIRSGLQDTSIGKSPDQRERQIRDKLIALPTVSKSVFTSKFPTLVNEVNFGKLMRLISQETRIIGSTTFDLKQPVDMLSFTFTYIGGKGLLLRDYIWSFRLRDKNTKDVVTDAVIEGLTKPPSNGHGFYRYARLVAGEKTGQVRIPLPKGVECEQFCIAPRNPNAPSLLIKDILVESS